MVEQTDEEIKKITVSTGKRDIVAALKVLSDKDRQYDLWMNIKTPGMSSLEEEQHALFDGLDRVKFKNYPEKTFSDKLCTKLSQLELLVAELESKSFDCFPKKLDHPKMKKMRELASDLLPMFEEELKQF